MEKSDSKSSGRAKRDNGFKRFWRPANLVKILVFLSIAFICGVFFFIRSESFLNWVEGRLESELINRMDDHTVDVGNIEGNILGSVTISSLSISKKDAPDPPIISTQKVVLKYNLLGFLTRKFEVKHLEVSEPQIHVVRNPDGSLNLERIFKERETQGSSQPQDSSQTQGSSQFDFAAERIEFSRGTIVYVDTQQDLRIAIDGITISVNGELSTWDHKGRLNIGSGSLTFNGAETAINNFDADFALLANGSRLDNLHLVCGNSDLTGYRWINARR